MLNVQSTVKKQSQTGDEHLNDDEKNKKDEFSNILIWQHRHSYYYY